MTPIILAAVLSSSSVTHWRPKDTTESFNCRSIAQVEWKYCLWEVSRLQKDARDCKKEHSRRQRECKALERR